MLIKNQWGDNVINIAHVRNIYVDKNGGNIVAQFEYGNEILGKYMSEDRCKEIIGNLLTDYSEGKKIFIMPSKEV